MAVLSNGVIGGALAYLLRIQGVNPGARRDDCRAPQPAADNLFPLESGHRLLDSPPYLALDRGRRGRRNHAGSVPPIEPGVVARRGTHVSQRMLRPADRRRLRRHDGHAAERSESSPRRQLLSGRIARLRSARGFRSGIARHAARLKCTGLDSGCHDRAARFRCFRRTRGAQGRIERRKPNPGAHLARVQSHVSALGCNSLHAHHHIPHGQRRSYRLAAGPVRPITG